MSYINKNLTKGDIEMKEYKVIETKKSQAETLMNEMAAQSWEVVSMTYWNAWKISLLITFSKDK